MDDCIHRVFDEIQSAESIRFSWLALSSFTIHRAWNIKDTDNGNIVSFIFKFWWGNLEVGSKLASLERWYSLDWKILWVHLRFIIFLYQRFFDFISLNLINFDEEFNWIMFFEIQFYKFLVIQKYIKNLKIIKNQLDFYCFSLIFHMMNL